MWSPCDAWRSSGSSADNDALVSRIADEIRGDWARQNPVGLDFRPLTVARGVLGTYADVFRTLVGIDPKHG